MGRVLSLCRRSCCCWRRYREREGRSPADDQWRASSTWRRNHLQKMIFHLRKTCFCEAGESEALRIVEARQKSDGRGTWWSWKDEVSESGFSVFWSSTAARRKKKMVGGWSWWASVWQDEIFGADWDQDCSLMVGLEFGDLLRLVFRRREGWNWRCRCGRDLLPFFCYWAFSRGGWWGRIWLCFRVVEKVYGVFEREEFWLRGGGSGGHESSLFIVKSVLHVLLYYGGWLQAFVFIKMRIWDMIIIEISPDNI